MKAPDGGLILKKFEIFSIGRIVNNQKDRKIEIDEPFREAMDGLEFFSHVNVFFWFHENDSKEGRSVLKVNPCKNPENPLTGVFATHSPLRPNLVGMTRCRITGLDRGRGLVHIDEIDAVDGTPLIDIKCYFPPDDAGETIRIPNWRRKRPQ
jgi:tRNA-Thr(GGU) m(6)t(6)A37 methyltransferase TsaA